MLHESGHYLTGIIIFLQNKGDNVMGIYPLAIDKPHTAMHMPLSA